MVGAGSIGQAIIRRVSAGKHIVLADYTLEHAEQAAKTLENAGFECSTIKCDLGSKEDILKLVEFATCKGEVTNVVNAAGVSPSQAPVEEILRVDLYGTSVLLEEFGKVIAEGGSGVIISSQSGHRLPALPHEQNEALATTPTDKLLVDGLKNPKSESGKTNILLIRTGEAKRGVIGLFQAGLKNEHSRGLSVRFRGIDDKGVASYLLSLYCSAAILADDAIAVLEDVEVGEYYDYD